MNAARLAVDSAIAIPDFFIAGAPRCGTTALYTYLRQHPQVFMPFHKEPLYFGSDLTRRYGRMSWEEYRALFRDARQGQRVGEASAWYLYSRTAAREIHAASPAARIIVMLRDPVEVMYAQYTMAFFTRQEEITDFAEALEAEEDRRRGRRLPTGLLRPENLFYREMVRFSDQLKRYLDEFGRERLHVIVHDDMRADVAGVYRGVLEFLDVDPDFQPVFVPVNEHKVFRSRLIQRLIYDPPILRAAIPRLRRYAPVHALRSRALAANSRQVERPPMDPHLRRKLEQELAPEVERLGALIGRDLSHWSSRGG